MSTVSKWAVLLVVTLGVGKIPVAPGTWGSLIAALFWWGLTPLSVPTALLFIALAFAVAWPCVHLYEKHSKSHDPKEVVIDELIGMWITMVSFPVTWKTLLAGFVLFRIFDILKPFPIGTIDRRVPGALGTILDDIVAGMMAWLALYLLVSGVLPWKIF